MNVIQFLEYLADHETTRKLAYTLADAWERQEKAPVRVNTAA